MVIANPTATTDSRRTYDSVEGVEGGVAIGNGSATIDSSQIYDDVCYNNDVIHDGVIHDGETHDDVTHDDVLNREGYETIERVRVLSQAFSLSLDQAEAERSQQGSEKDNKSANESPLIFDHSDKKVPHSQLFDDSAYATLGEVRDFT